MVRFVYVPVGEDNSAVIKTFRDYRSLFDCPYIRTVRVIDCHGGDPERISHDPYTMNVLLWSLPINFTDYVCGRINYLTFDGKVYDLIGGQRDAYIISNPHKYKAVKDDAGRILALIEGNCVYIVFDLFHVVEHASTLMPMIFSRVLEVYTQFDEEEVYGKIIEGITKQNVIVTNDMLWEIEELHRRLQKKLSEYYRAKRYSKVFNIEKLKNELDRVSKLRVVESVDLTPSGVVITIHPRVGILDFKKWRIRLSDEVVITSAYMWSFPYYYEGAMCLGDFKVVVEKLYSRLEICTLVQTVVQYITRYDVSTSVRRLEGYLLRIKEKEKLDKYIYDKLEVKSYDISRLEGGVLHIVDNGGNTYKIDLLEDRVIE